jgi:single-strand DNA-binding protein
MATMNRVLLAGNMAREPRWCVLPSGTAVCNIVLATTGLQEDRQTGRMRQSTEWHRVVLIGALAEQVRGRLRKGDAVHVEGRLQTRSWRDRAGVMRYMTEIIVEVVQVHTKARPADQAGGIATRLDDHDIAAWVAEYDRAFAREAAGAAARDMKRH